MRMFNDLTLLDVISEAERALEAQNLEYTKANIIEISADVLSAETYEDWELCREIVEDYLSHNSVVYGGFKRRGEDGDAKQRRKVKPQHHEEEDFEKDNDEENYEEETEAEDASPDVDIDSFDDPVADVNTVLQREEENKQRKHILNLLTSLDSFEIGTDGPVREEMAQYTEPLREQLERALVNPGELNSEEDA